MSASSLQDRIGNVFVQHLHIQPPSPDKDLIESGIIDSLTFVELLARLEQEFSIRIPLDDLDLNQFRSIARIREFVRAQTPTSKVAA
jgi:methoxymalonate biosynthesis acyl carrier protein